MLLLLLLLLLLPSLLDYWRLAILVLLKFSCRPTSLQTIGGSGGGDDGCTSDYRTSLEGCLRHTQTSRGCSVVAIFCEWRRRCKRCRRRWCDDARRMWLTPTLLLVVRD